MIMLPCWIKEEDEQGYRVRMGSEPRADSKIDLIPHDCVLDKKIVPDEIIPVTQLPIPFPDESRFAILFIDETKAPVCVTDALRISRSELNANPVVRPRGTQGH